MRTLDKTLINVERWICGFGMLFITFLAFGGVVLRQVFGITLSWVEEMSQYIMVWIAFFGGALCISENGHVGIDVLQNFLPKRWHGWYKLALNLFSGLFLIWFTYVAAKYTITIHQSGQSATSMSWMPRSFLYISGALAGALMVVEYLKVAYKVFIQIKNKEYAVEEVPVEKLEHM